jgi:hypothetical protein
MPAPSSTLLVGRYRLIASLGQGGMGRVWRAHDEVLHRDVAIKEIIPPEGLAQDERSEIRRRTLREARAAARLSHPNVIRIYDVFEADNRPWIVMEYLPSRSLHEVISTDGPLPPARVAEIGLGILAALRASHSSGVLHRDVKPSNVLLSEDGRVVLSDFGIATVPGEASVTTPGLVLGSPAYIAPERARDGTAGPESDLWSLGATLYAAVEGRSPYQRSSALATLAALATEDPSPPRRAGPLKGVLDGLLRKNPADRIDPAEVERLLRRAVSRSGRAAAWRPVFWQRRPAGAAGAAGAVGAGAGAAGAAGRAEAEAGARGPGAAAAGPGVAAASPPAEAAVAAERAPVAAGPATAAKVVSAQPAAPAEVPEPEPATVALGKVYGGRRGIVHVRRAVLAVLAIAGLVLTLAVVFADTDKETGAGRWKGGPATSTPPVQGESPPGVPAPTSSSAASGTDGGGQTGGPVTGVALPAGWRVYRDPENGFRVAVPVGWNISYDGTIVYFREPGGGRVLGIDKSDTPKPDPLADWRTQSAYRVARGDFPGYQEIKIVAVDYFVKAADWEYTYDGRTARLHVLNRNFITSPTQAYAIFWLTADSQWAANLPNLDLIIRSFQPGE